MNFKCLKFFELVKKRNDKKDELENVCYHLKKVLDKAHVNIEDLADKPFLINEIINQKNYPNKRQSVISVLQKPCNEIHAKLHDNLTVNRLKLGGSEIHVGRIGYSNPSCSNLSILNLNLNESMGKNEENLAPNLNFYIQEETDSVKMGEDVFDLITRKPSKQKEKAATQERQTINIISPFFPICDFSGASIHLT